MNWLAENALVIWAIGAVALTMALVVYTQTRSQGSLLAIVLVVVVTGALLILENALESPREAVARTLDEIAVAVRTNDMPRVLSYIDPAAAQLRKEIETAMPLATIERAAIVGEPMITVGPNGDPTQARVECRAFVQGALKNSGMKGGQMANCIVTLTKQGDRWMVTEYAADQDWRRAAGAH
jgi:hypothetical protein